MYIYIYIYIYLDRAIVVLALVWVCDLGLNNHIIILYYVKSSFVGQDHEYEPRTYRYTLHVFEMAFEAS